MFETILTSAIVAGLTGLFTFALQERRLRADLRTEFMAEAVAKKLLQAESWRKRSFEQIQQRLRGFDDNELRKILVRAGAACFSSRDGKEMWGLLDRNADDL